MISNPINVSTGPVTLHPLVQAALAEQPISHRSPLFETIYRRTTDFLCNHFNTKEAFIFTGSGTAANDAMLLQIKNLSEPGLVLSNGEFGNRLRAQSAALDLKFQTYEVSWGEAFDLKQISQIINELKLGWVLFCHCETSTGVVNDIEGIANLCELSYCKTFVDCISSVGCLPIDLSKVSMATASSGKGLGSIAGLAILFSNIQIYSCINAPVYLDLQYHQSKNGIAFTISSNLLKALFQGCLIRLNSTNYNNIEANSEILQSCLNATFRLPFNNKHVFTVDVQKCSSGFVADRLLKENIECSYHSAYLAERNWLQIALFSTLSYADIHKLLKVLHKNFEDKEIVKESPTLSTYIESDEALDIFPQ